MGYFHKVKWDDPTRILANQIGDLDGEHGRIVHHHLRQWDKPLCLIISSSKEMLTLVNDTLKTQWCWTFHILRRASLDLTIQILALKTSLLTHFNDAKSTKLFDTPKKKTQNTPQIQLTQRLFYNNLSYNFHLAKKGRPIVVRSYKKLPFWQLSIKYYFIRPLCAEWLGRTSSCFFWIIS